MKLNGFGLNLNLEPGNKVDFDFVVKSTIQNPLSKFVQEMEPVAVHKHVKDDLDAPLEANVHSQFRGGVGQLQWLQLQGHPLLSFATGILQSRSATPNGHDPLSLNKWMREAKSMPDLCWWIVSVLSSFVWLTAADAAWANRHDGSSTSGHVVMAAHPDILLGESSTVSLLACNSRKIRRVVSVPLEPSVQHSPRFVRSCRVRNTSPSDVRERLQEPGRCSPSLQLHPALHRALWCAGHPTYVSRTIFVSVFIQCYFTYCVVLAFSAHSEQCDILVCSNHETCLLVYPRTQ